MMRVATIKLLLAVYFQFVSTLKNQKYHALNVHVDSFSKEDIQILHKSWGSEL